MFFWDPGSEIRDGKKPGSGIRDKHPGSATLQVGMSTCIPTGCKTTRHTGTKLSIKGAAARLLQTLLNYNYYQFKRKTANWATV